ncbi:MAG: AmmeMemoRadiSam system radical SAM enzyme [Candidatus Omnitrophota bacterium]
MKKAIPIALILSLALIMTADVPFASAEPSKSSPRIASYWNKIKDGIVQCVLCPRKCVLAAGQRGFCTVRVNKAGELYTLGYGNPVSVHVDPIEKKPFFHVLPGEAAFSLAVAGCNMRCLFCQNWQISQSKPDEVAAYDLPPEKIVDAAVKSNSPIIVYTYTEPTVFYEYMLDIAKLAKAKGLRNGMHSCGYINPEPLKELLVYMDAVNVDLKGFSPEFYARMGDGASLEPVLETLKTVKGEGVWLEITNLIIPGQNDDPGEIRAMCRWIKDNLGAEVPLHFSRFVPSFKLMNLPPTPAEKLEEACDIAKQEGLKYVYVGNMPGNDRENTYCPNCGKLAISRRGYQVSAAGMSGSRCANCGYALEGIWRE